MNYLFALLLLTSFNVDAQDSIENKDKTLDFDFSVESHLDKARHIAFGIEPLSGSLSTKSSLLVGAHFDIANLANRLCFGGDFFYGYNTKYSAARYSVYQLNEKPVRFDLNLNVGITIQYKSEISDRTVNLKSSRTVNYKAVLPVKTITSLTLIAGLNRTSLTSRDAGSISYKVYDWDGHYYTEYLPVDLLIGQKKSSVTLGFKKRVSTHSLYKTSSHGAVRHSREKVLTGELLFGIPSVLPTFYGGVYNNSTGETSYLALANIQLLASQVYKELPIGVRVGYKHNTRNVAGFGWNASAGVYPGYYSKFYKAIQVKLGFTYNFLFKF